MPTKQLNFNTTTRPIWVIVIFLCLQGSVWAQFGGGGTSILGLTSVNGGDVKSYSIFGTPNIVSTTWSVNGGATIQSSTAIEATISFNNPGTVTISATSRDAMFNYYNASLVVTVANNAPSTPPMPTITQYCGYTRLTRGSPPSQVTYFWQSSPSGTSLSNSSSYVDRTSGSVYYLRARSSIGQWSSARTVNYSINTVPSTPPTPSVSNNCGNSVLTRGAPPSGITYYWQSSSSGTSTSNASLSITRTSGSTYYIRARNNSSGCWSTARSVNYSIQAVPSIPSTPTVTNNCGNTVLTRSGHPSNATLYWQSSSSGTSTSNSSLSLTRTSGTVYYLRARHNSTGCWGATRTINYSVNSIPGVPSVPAVTNNCGSTLLTRSAPPGGVTWYWQSSSSGTSTSNSALSISLTSGSAYYLRGRNNSSGCWGSSQTVNYTIQQASIWYADTDLDGYGDPGSTTSSCTKPTNYVSNNLDACPGTYGVRNGCSYVAPTPSNDNYVHVRTFQKAVSSATNTSLITKDADVIEQVNYFDGLGRPLQNVAVKASGFGAVNNVSEWSLDWKAGSGGTPFFNQNGTTSENEREMGINPFGNQELLWKCGNDSSSGADGGWNTAYFNVDKTATYRYTVWVKRTHSQDGKTYHGTRDVNRLDGSANNNPYFWSGDLPVLDQWYLLVGVVHPYNYSGGDTGVSGVYDVMGNRIVDGTEYTWRSDTTTSSFRSYLYYATDTSTRQYFWNPTLQKVDGTEASLTTLINQQFPFDIVTQHEYDAVGRKANDLLPYCELNGILGAHRGNMAGATRQFYETHYKADFPTVTGSNVNAHSEKEFEDSPLNRVMKQAAPGEDWKMGSGHEIAFGYDSNGGTEVRRFSVSLTYANNTYTPSLTQNGHYAVGELYKNITYDENYPGTGTDHTTEEFTDKLGRVLLKRTYDGSAHDTYYVYDEYGNLTYVLPPKVTTSSVSSTELDELCYQYKYDDRNRLVEKKLPGKGWEYIVYNQLDQPIMTQDAEQELDDEWLFTKYDPFGRVAFTGMVSSTDDRSTHQTAADIEADQYESRRGTAINHETGTLVPVFYSNDAYPNTGIDKIYTINYYDDYLNPTDMDNLDVPSTVLGEPKATNTTGLPTVSKVRVLDTSHWITTITGYDQKGRAIYTASKNNYLSTTDIVESQLDFPGKVLQTKATHTKGANPAIITVDDFTYDHMGRLLKQTQTLGGQTETLVENAYDEMGQLTQKIVGGGLQTVDYDYNVRGWLKQINDPASLGGDLFAFGINYNTVGHGGSALSNGNIAETEWKTANDNTLRWYRYGYDALNRITSATAHSSNYNVSAITYDKNGNLETLIRRGHTNSGATSFGNMDVLDYDYDSGNKLTKVTDTGNATYGFADGINQTTEYTYDTNGNMLRDYNKGITSDIDYNHLNLPINISINGAGGSGNITYIYDATGVKLKKTVGSSVTEYAGNYVYQGGTLQFFNQPEGYVTPNGGGGYDYVYQYKDHLGNVRLSYMDNGSTTEIVEESNYYPFGLKHKGYNTAVSANGNSVAQKWGYLGQEIQDELGLDWLTFRYRNYIPELGRFFGVDPISEDFLSISNYQFAHNSPIWKIEIEGLEGEVSPEIPGAVDIPNHEPVRGNSHVGSSAIPIGDGTGNHGSNLRVRPLSEARTYNVKGGYPGQAIDELATRGIQYLGSRISGSNVSRQTSEYVQLGTSVLMLIVSKGRSGKAASEIIESLGKSASSKSLSKITLNTSKLNGSGADALDGIIKKTNNIGTHLSPNDLKGAVKDILGQPVTIDGKVFDHLGEVNDALKGLGKQLSKLNKNIADGTFSGDVLEAAKSLRTQLQNQKDQIQNVLNKASREANGF